MFKSSEIIRKNKITVSSILFCNSFYKRARRSTKSTEKKLRCVSIFFVFFLYFYSFDIRIGFWTDFWLYSYASRQKNVKANTIVNNKRKKKKPHWLYFENTNTFVLLNFNSIFGKSSFFAYSVHHRWYNKVTPWKWSGAFERTKDFV